MNNVRIKDIYAGKPDAKDEIYSEGFDKFIDSFVVPSNFDIESLVSGSFCFITGYKGTGKTALLYYLDNYIKKVDSAACSSFIFFKNDYPDVKRRDMEALSKRLISSISIGSNVILDGRDFEYIWRWLFYQRIWEDNLAYGCNLFIDDEKWEAFSRKISKINAANGKRILRIPPKFKFGVPITDATNTMSVSPELELDFTSPKSSETHAFQQFTKIIEELDDLFPSLERTDIPYYIFVDELEAYYGEKLIFERDLRLIRDLIFTIKKLNSQMSGFASGKTKIICSVRTEIINAINRFVIAKELNKVTSGFEVPLVWDYTNTNSFEHPILKIFMKRIEVAENQNGYKISEKKIIKKWFPEKIKGIEPSNYVLNNSWFKPRDIVRLVLSAKACLCSNYTSFTQATFEMLRKRYSKDSLNEIREEMRALYTSDQIDCIITCLTGFRAVFSIDELKSRITRYFSGSILEKDLTTVLKDLFRLGLIGNFSGVSRSYRWHHKGDDELIISDEWKIMIHFALQSALSISNRYDRRIQMVHKAIPKVNEIVKVRVERIVPGFVLVNFKKEGELFKGSIHISKLSKVFIPDIFTFTTVGNSHVARILEYDLLHKKWELSLLDIEDE